MYKKITFFVILSFFLGSIVLATFKPNDFFYNNQWYLSKIEADKAWSTINSSPDIIIAVIDSGVDINHPDLKNNIWTNTLEIAGNNIDDDNNGFIDDINGWDFVNNNFDPRPKFNDDWTESGISHGTIVSGIIGATGNNNEGVSGITWDAQIMPLKAINDKGEGKISNIIKAIDYATKNGAHIINLSFMNLTYSQSMQDAIERANKAGVMIVAAAGNDQNGEGYDTSKNPIYPACYDGNLVGQNMVIGVAATDALDQKTSFSSYGSQCVDISAPGISFFSTIFQGGNKNDSNLIYDGYFSGTSMAAPQVSATLALITQINPKLNSQEIISILLASVDNINNLNPNYINQLGNGRLNINRAVLLARSKLYDSFGLLFVIPDERSNDYISNNNLASPEFLTASGIHLNSLDKSIFNNYSTFVSADLNDDEIEEIVMGASKGYESRIKVVNKDGKEKFSFTAYNENINSALLVEVADVLGDDKLEILVAREEGGDGKIKIFSNDGKLIKEVPAYDKNFKGKISLSAGNIDGKGKSEIILGVSSSLRIISSDGKLIGAFYPFGKDSNGFSLKVDNLDGRKNKDKDEIIVVPIKGEQALVKIFDNHANLLNKFMSFGANWYNGVNLSTGDTNNDGISEIILGVKAGGAPHVRVFSLEGKILQSFYAWDSKISSGINVLQINI